MDHLDTLIGIFGGGVVSFLVTHYLGNKQLDDLRKLHKRQQELKHNLHDQQLEHDRDIANLILRSLRYKEEHPTQPIPLIDKNMNLIFDLHPDEEFHFDDTDHLFSWDELPMEIE